MREDCSDLDLCRIFGSLTARQKRGFWLAVSAAAGRSGHWASQHYHNNFSTALYLNRLCPRDKALVVAAVARGMENESLSKRDVVREARRAVQHLNVFHGRVASIIYYQISKRQNCAAAETTCGSRGAAQRTPANTAAAVETSSMTCQTLDVSDVQHQAPIAPLECGPLDWYSSDCSFARAGANSYAV